jgi:3-methyladenine DNA glycosylase AlkD
VDASAEHIVERHLGVGNSGPLEQLARSRILWERRIAILATFHFIKQQEFGPTLKVSEILLSNGHDLIHKAVGRRSGGRSRAHR